MFDEQIIEVLSMVKLFLILFIFKANKEDLEELKFILKRYYDSSSFLQN